MQALVLRESVFVEKRQKTLAEMQLIGYRVKMIGFQKTTCIHMQISAKKDWMKCQVVVQFESQVAQWTVNDGWHTEEEVTARIYEIQSFCSKANFSCHLAQLVQTQMSFFSTTQFILLPIY